jgi:hypothetical protein
LPLVIFIPLVFIWHHWCKTQCKTKPTARCPFSGAQLSGETNT